MIIAITLFVLTGIGIYLNNKTCNFKSLGIIISIIFGSYFIMHLLIWSLASYDYNLFVEKRKAFVSTLENARNKGRELEAAAITREVAEWNKSLASSKYTNTVFLLGDYIDDRIEDLEPIE